MSRYIVNRAGVSDWYVLDILAKAPAEVERRFKDGSATGKGYPYAEYAQTIADNLNADYEATTRRNMHAVLRSLRPSRYHRLVLLLRWHVTRNNYMERNHPLSSWYWRRLSRLQNAMDRATG